MPEYVYALHEFTPQVSDEIEFKIGDRIEVVEKDDLYGDGWWQVSSASGLNESYGRIGVMLRAAI